MLRLADFQCLSALVRKCILDIWFIYLAVLGDCVQRLGRNSESVSQSFERVPRLSPDAGCHGNCNGLRGRERRIGLEDSGQLIIGQEDAASV